MSLVQPYTIAYETISSTSNIILKINTSSGLTGWGCAAPDMEVTHESPEDVVENVERHVTGLLKNESPFQVARITHQLKQLCPRASSTIAMVDMSLFDLMARKAKLPLYQLLGGYRNEIATSITIGILPVKETLEQAGYYLKKGFRHIKIKGGIDLDADVERILKVRDKYGHDFSIRFDANQGYTPSEALKFIDLTSRAGIEILEQPTKQKKDEQLGEVTRQIDIPVMADESVQTLRDAFKLASRELIDLVNIKIMKVGGILESQHINSVSKAAGIEVMVGCIDECAMGISAGLHFALSRPNIAYADLDGHLDLLDDPFTDLFHLRHGILSPTTHPGLGKINL
jgi:L-alanine-DL-glutamate epimerase-like enolase superfamily enzyme